MLRRLTLLIMLTVTLASLSGCIIHDPGYYPYHSFYYYEPYYYGPYLYAPFWFGFHANFVHVHGHFHGHGHGGFGGHRGGGHR